MDPIQINVDELSEDIFTEVNKFLQRAREDSKEVEQQAKDQDYYAGNFWTPEVRKRFGQKKNMLVYNGWSPMVNIVSNMAGDNPWVPEVENPELNSAIDSFRNKCRKADIQCFRDAVSCGAGYGLIRWGESGELEFERIKNVKSVFMDPLADEVSAKNARECAILRFISNNNEFGQTGNKITYNGVSPEHSSLAQIVDLIYFKKVDEGVEYYRIVGQKVVEACLLPGLTRIPVIRYSGYECMQSQKIHYEGIVRKTFDIMALINVAFTMMNTRLTKQIRSKILLPEGAFDNLKTDELKAAARNCFKEDSAILPFAGQVAPTILQENVSTDDLKSFIDTLLDLASICTGVASIDKNATQAKTATETNQRIANQFGSVSELFTNYEYAWYAIAEIVCSYYEGQHVNFKLVNGPDAFKKHSDEQNQILAISQIQSPYLQAEFARTCTIDKERHIADNLMANFSDFTMLPEDASEQVRMVNEIKQLQMELQQKDEELVNLQTEVEEIPALKEQLDQVSLQKADFQVRLDENDKKWQAKIAEMEEEYKKNLANNAKINAEAEKIMAETEKLRLENEQLKQQLGLVPVEPAIVEPM